MAFPSSEQKENDPLFIKPFDPDGFKHVHGQRNIEQAFLFRIDPVSDGRTMILVQSGIEPDWGYAFKNAPFLAASPEVKPFNKKFEQNQKFQFRLLANPVRKISPRSVDDEGKPLDKKWIGKRVPVPKGKLEEWLTRKAEHSGFRVERFTAIQPGYIYIKGHEDDKEGKGGQGNRLFSARYEGILEVTNTADFQKTLTSGIGPGKAFGFGLLSVAKLK